MKRAYTLIELILVVVIVSFLSVATYKAIEKIVIKSHKTKEITRLSLESQTVLNQISEYLKYRVPSTVIGYDPQNGEFEYIGDITSEKKIIEWIGRSIESFYNKDYSGFMDMDTKEGDTVYSLDTNGSKISNSVKRKYGISSNIYTQKIVNLIFAGSFDKGLGDIYDYKNAFGWHGNDSNNSFNIDISDEGNITVTDSDKPEFLYEKYFLVDGAYAIARGEDIDTDADCIKDLNISSKDINNTLFIFYNYRPWKGETFCADPLNAASKEGNASVLMKNVARFRFEESDSTIKISLDLNKSVRGSIPIHLSKMKVVF